MSKLGLNTKASSTTGSARFEIGSENYTEVYRILRTLQFTEGVTVTISKQKSTDSIEVSSNRGIDLCLYECGYIALNREYVGHSKHLYGFAKMFVKEMME